MIKKLCVVLTIVFCLLLITNVYADIYSDPVFASATVNLKNSKSVTFSAITYDEKDSITVTSVKLYKKDSNDNWVYQGDIPIPTNPDTTPITYGASKDYSAFIGSGTYRIKATFCADGYSISRYSNIRTF